MRFEVLGPLRVTAGGHLIGLGPPQQRLLALLLVANEGLSADSVVEELWNGRPPPSARHLVEVHASTLRAALASVEPEPRLVARRNQPDRFPQLLAGIGPVHLLTESDPPSRRP